MFSFAISQRSLERIGLSIAGLVLVGFATVLSVLFFLQVRNNSFIHILKMCFLCVSVSEKLYVKGSYYEQSCPHDFLQHCTCNVNCNCFSFSLCCDHTTDNICLIIFLKHFTCNVNCNCSRRPAGHHEMEIYQPSTSSLR